jgi:hypothetical protein
MPGEVEAEVKENTARPIEGYQWACLIVKDM